MNIIYQTKKLEKLLTNKAACRKRFGHLSDVLFRKLEYIRSASNLPELRNISGHLHELKQVKGTYSISLKHPFRLVLLPMSDNTITLVTIEDYHGSPRRIQNYTY